MDVKIYVLPLGGECTHIYLSVTALMHSIIQHMLAYVFLRLVTAGSPLLICNFFFFFTISNYLFPLWIHSNNFHDITEVKPYHIMQ